MKKVVYICITGGYDDIPIHNYVAPDWDYILYTDNKELIQAGHIAHWTVRPLVFDKLSNVKNNRWHKINAHKIFPEYDYSLYLDANIIVNNKNIFDLADRLIKKKVLFAAPSHPARKCVYDEAQIIKQLNIDYPKTVDKEIKILRRDKYPEKAGLSENNILLRNHNKIQEALNLWWYMVEKYSKRDQLSLQYALWKTGTDFTRIYTNENGFGYHRESPDFTFVQSEKHNQDKIKTNRILVVVARIISIFIPIAKYRRRFRSRFIRS